MKTQFYLKKYVQYIFFFTLLINIHYNVPWEKGRFCHTNNQCHIYAILEINNFYVALIDHCARTS